MMTVKDLFENEELMDNIVEDIEEIPDDAEVVYALWAIGYDKDNEITRDELLLGEFVDPDEAVAYAKDLAINDITTVGFGAPDPKTAYFSLEVETVVYDIDDEDDGTMNIGTIYKRDLWLVNRHGTEEETGLVDEDLPDYGYPIVATGKGDYELLDDGTLKLSAKFMKGFNKNDCIRVQFIDEPNACLLPYKIVSMVEYEDGEYFHCEIML